MSIVIFRVLVRWFALFLCLEKGAFCGTLQLQWHSLIHSFIHCAACCDPRKGTREEGKKEEKRLHKVSTEWWQSRLTLPGHNCQVIAFDHSIDSPIDRSSLRSKSCPPLLYLHFRATAATLLLGNLQHLFLFFFLFTTHNDAIDLSRFTQM